MSDRIEAWAQSLLEIAKAEGNLHAVDGEPLRFDRAVEGTAGPRRRPPRR